MKVTADRKKLHHPEVLNGSKNHKGASSGNILEENKFNIGAVAYKNFELNGDSSGNLMKLLDRLEKFDDSKDISELLREIMESARFVMNTEASSLMLLDEDTGELTVKTSTGPVGKEIEGKRIPRYEGYGGWVVQHKIPLIDNSVSRDSEPYWGELSESFKTRNLICAPLLNKKGEVIGVIEAVNRYEGKDFHYEDLPVFQALGKHAARAIERHRSKEDRFSMPSTNGKGENDNNLLITELHHRMKNNLSLITGMVEMEESKLDDRSGRQVLKKIQSRVKSINIVYDLLSGLSKYDEIELSSYVSELVEEISKAHATPVRDIQVVVNAEEVKLDPDRALYCGLILNELLVNSYKHAFKYKDKGRIEIDIVRVEHRIIIKYKDDGIGMPVDFDPEDVGSMGFEIIHSLTDKLDGTFSFDKKKGYKGIRCSLSFSLD